MPSKWNIRNILIQKKKTYSKETKKKCTIYLIHLTYGLTYNPIHLGT